MSQATWHTGDALTILRTLPSASVDLVMTSPPFLALRSYLPADHPDKGLEVGSEGTPGAFLDVLLDVTEELARVLAPHGSLVMELGDTYSGSGESGQHRVGHTHDLSQIGAKHHGTDAPRVDGRTRDLSTGWPLAKSLCMIPSSFAWALAYGRNPWTGRQTPPWRVRNLIAWCRPNPPVGALGDKFRPGTSYLTVATKSANRYFDLDAVREPHSGVNAEKQADGWTNTGSHKYAAGADGITHVDGHRPYGNPAGAPPLDWWEIPTHPDDEYETGGRYTETTKGGGRREPLSGDRGGSAFDTHPAGAPPLDHWIIPTHPYPGSHYATVPPQLVVRPVKAMCPLRVCRVCGKPSERITEREHVADDAGGAGGAKSNASTQEDWREAGAVRLPERRAVLVETLGWSDCGHDDYRAGTVLDPFAGSGTTLEVATGHGRDAIGIDLDPRNYDLARSRIGMFLEMAS